MAGRSGAGRSHRQQGLLLTGGGLVLGTLVTKGLYERRLELRLRAASRMASRS